ncbi:hypothetical protein AVEN_74873-1 [Araneus ventricosus]|uniref:Uncharacterized protein n=1 Tax=Araneus ventricosus TaxID=182803 RepID=A0A4Y2D295_ARAVE|nr:hypothetical protein AVEN_74873-1 [Araneus ventricosus]
MLAGLPMIQVPRALSPLPDVPNPPVAKAVSLSSAGKCTQDYVHREMMVVVCIRADGFILSTGRMPYSCDRPSKKRLRTSSAEIGARKVFFTDAGTKRYYKRFFRKIKLPYQTFLMDHRIVQLGITCPVLPPCVSSLDGGAKRHFRLSENGRDSALNDVRLLDQSETVFSFWKCIKGLLR